jgi:tetraacyldisaccharide 4'-kinase
LINNLVDAGWEVGSLDINKVSNLPKNVNFHEQDIHYLDHLPIVMTEKDASKCKDFDNNKIWYLTIEADVSDKFINELDTKIKSIN